MSTREMAHKILDDMNEEQLLGFIALFRVQDLSAEPSEQEERNKAYHNLRKMIKPIQNLDYDKELADYREERYGV